MNNDTENSVKCDEEESRTQNNESNDDEEGFPVPSRPHHTTWMNPVQIVAMISNFSTSYNVVNISLVLPILHDLHNGSLEDEAACASSLLAGMIVGQIVGGALGDSFLGRLGALRLMMFIQIIASIGSALIWSENIYFVLSIWRFFLGIGAGAVYPLAAVLSAEQQTNDDNNNNSAVDSENETSFSSSQEKVSQLRNVVITFSMQGVGFLAVPIFTLSMLYIVPKNQIDLIWRLLLGIGCIPGIILVFLQLFLYRHQPDLEVVSQIDEPVEGDENNTPFENTTWMNNREEPLRFVENEEMEESRSSSNIEEEENEVLPHGMWCSVLKEPNLVQKLLGTAATWFLFDVLFYGNTLFQPIVFEAAFGSKKTDETDLIKKVATDSMLLGLIALPGYIISVLVVGKRICNIIQTPRYIQLQGFAAMAILYSIIGAYWSYLKRTPFLLITFYGLTFFFASYGPNTTTFIFPSLVYSKDFRSSLNGISAAAGKVGALVGASLFAPATASLGDDKVMLICAGISVIAFAFTSFFTRIPEQYRQQT